MDNRFLVPVPHRMHDVIWWNDQGKNVFVLLDLLHLIIDRKAEAEDSALFVKVQEREI